MLAESTNEVICISIKSHIVGVPIEHANYRQSEQKNVTSFGAQFEYGVGWNYELNYHIYI